MAVEILNSAFAQDNETFTVNTTGAELLLLVGGCADDSFSGTPVLDGVGASGYWAGVPYGLTTHPAVLIYWLNPNQGASKSVSTKLYHANNEYMWYAVKGVKSTNFKSSRAGSGSHTLTADINLPTGMLFGVGRTARSGYGVTSGADQLQDLYVNWRTYQYRIDRKLGSIGNAMSWTYSAASGGASAMLAVEGFTGVAKVIAFFKKWREQTDPYQSLLRKGSIPIGAQI